MSPEAIAFIVLIFVLDAIFLLAALKTVPEFERAIIYTKGTPTRIVGPGLVFVLPLVQKMEKFKTPLDVSDWDNGKGNVIIDYKTFPAVSTDALDRGDKVMPTGMTDGHIQVQKIKTA